MVDSNSNTFSHSNTSECSTCAPGCTYSDGSCLSDESVRKIADSYNTDTDVSDEQIDTSLPKKNIVQRLENKLGKTHKKWLLQNCVKRLNDSTINNYTFKPKRPEGKYKWLSTPDISKVLKQYEKVYKDFEFYGPVPVDFATIVTDLNDLDLKDAYNNKNKSKFGIIYNLDEHYKSGSHWVSSYLDLNKNEFSYFDSYATNPPKRIFSFMKKVKEYCKKIFNKNIELKINKKRFQYANSECGVYSIFYILEHLQGKSFEQITNRPVNDETVNQNRLKYYTR